MTAQTFNIIRYDADDGKVFDWKTPHKSEDENGEEIIEHLNAKTVFIGEYDDISNYVEVDVD